METLKQLDSFDKISLISMISLIVLLSYATMTNLNIDTKGNVYKILTNNQEIQYVSQVK